MRASWMLTLCTAFVVGCAGEVIDEGTEEEPVSSAEEAIIDNGVRLNGVRLNGVRLNGVRLNGVRLNGVELTGVEVNGTSFSATVGGVVKTGPALVGSVAQGELSDGGTIELRVNAVVPSSDPEIIRYDVVYRESAIATWKPICGTDAHGNDILAIPAMGRWDESEGTATGGSFIDDPTMFSIACEGSAIEKCVGAGYKPWKTVTECKAGVCQSRSLRFQHQACTRMIRADYCGDGKTHTMDGVPLNIWDTYGIQVQEAVGPGWKHEAEWGSEGAICIQELRVNVQKTTEKYVNAFCPTRKKTSFGCFAPNSTFFTASGFTTPLDTRSLLRDDFDKDEVNLMLKP